MLKFFCSVSGLTWNVGQVEYESFTLPIQVDQSSFLVLTHFSKTNGNIFWHIENNFCFSRLWKKAVFSFTLVFIFDRLIIVFYIFVCYGKFSYALM